MDVKAYAKLRFRPRPDFYDPLHVVDRALPGGAAGTDARHDRNSLSAQGHDCLPQGVRIHPAFRSDGNHDHLIRTDAKRRHDFFPRTVHGTRSEHDRGSNLLTKLPEEMPAVVLITECLQ